MYPPVIDNNPNQTNSNVESSSRLKCNSMEQGFQKYKIMILVVENVSLTTVASIMDPFLYTNKILRCDRFDLELVSLLEDPPLTTSRVRIECDKSSKQVLAHGDIKNRPDFVMLACGQEIDKSSQKALQAFLRKLAATSVPFVALGAANAYAVTTGLIRADKCVAHWETIGLLRENFPAIDFLNVLFETSERGTSCAGELAALDFAISFIERHCGSSIAQKISSHLLLQSRRSGNAVQLLNGSAMLCENGLIKKAVAMMLDHIERPISIVEICDVLKISTRQLERIFARYGFETPSQYYKKLRLERARQLLEQSELSLTEAGLVCGFKSLNNFSKSFKKLFGVSPRDFRTPLGPLRSFRKSKF